MKFRKRGKEELDKNRLTCSLTQVVEAMKAQEQQEEKKDIKQKKETMKHILKD